MKVSYCMIPAGPLDDVLAAVDAADASGFHGVYTVDEPWWRSAREMLTLAAVRTRRVRLGPDVTHLVHNPVFTAQALATLDGLSGGRAEAVISTGSPDMLGQLGITLDRPVARLREAHAIIRALLDTGEAGQFDGEFYQVRDMFLTARPRQDHLPVMLGGMAGPLSFRLAGEVADGLHHAGSYSLPALGYVAGEFARGAQRAHRNPGHLDLAAWIGGVVAADGDAARRAARFMTAFYLPATPAAVLARHGIDPAEVKPVTDAVAAGDIAGAAALLPPEIAAAQCVAGTPEECAARIGETFAPAGFTHLVFGLAGGPAIRALTGTDPGGVPPAAEQVDLIARRLVPALR
jgi:5,10-methylenetetrahydromethanopterin reductase